MTHGSRSRSSGFGSINSNAYGSIPICSRNPPTQINLGSILISQNLIKTSTKLPFEMSRFIWYLFVKSIKFPGGSVSVHFSAERELTIFSQISVVTKLQRWASKLSFKVRKSPIRIFLGSSRYHKCANFLGVAVCKSQIHESEGGWFIQYNCEGLRILASTPHFPR